MIYVVGRKQVERALSTVQPQYAISIGEKSEPIPTGLYGLPKGSWLRLEFDDCEYDLPHPMLGYFGITRADADALVTFLRQIEPEANVLIHCAAGISRSSATALCLLALWETPGKEADALPKLEAVRAESTRLRLRSEHTLFIPNRRVVHYFEEITGTQGRLRSALEDSYGTLYPAPFDAERV